MPTENEVNYKTWKCGCIIDEADDKVRECHYHRVMREGTHEQRSAEERARDWVREESKPGGIIDRAARAAGL